MFCDISKAFDRVWHRGLLFKLESIGVSDSLILWFSDYLAERKQRVVLPGAASSWKNIKAGVPQGSILGPLLFLIYINDIHTCIRLFADDTSLYIIVDNPLQAADTLNADLAKIHSWASKWLASFNPSKSESILFSRKHNRPFHPPLNMDQQAINEVTSYKHLGLIFSNDCNWNEHIDCVKTKKWFRINIMRKLKFQLETIYVSFIRPLLESLTSFGTTALSTSPMNWKKSRMKLPVSSLEPRNLYLSTLFIPKRAGKVLLLEGKNISLHYTITCKME